MLHSHVTLPPFKAIKYEQTEYANVAYACFSDKWHDDIDDAYVYEMK